MSWSWSRGTATPSTLLSLWILWRTCWWLSSLFNTSCKVLVNRADTHEEKNAAQYILVRKYHVDRNASISTAPATAAAYCEYILPAAASSNTFLPSEICILCKVICIVSAAPHTLCCSRALRTVLAVTSCACWMMTSSRRASSASCSHAPTTLSGAGRDLSRCRCQSRSWHAKQTGEGEKNNYPFQFVVHMVKAWRVTI